MLMTVVFVRLVSLHQCRPTLESASNYIIIIILDGFISDCMRIYCTSHDDIHPRRTAGEYHHDACSIFSYNPQCHPILYNYRMGARPKITDCIPFFFLQAWSSNWWGVFNQWSNYLWWVITCHLHLFQIGHLHLNSTHPLWKIKNISHSGSVNFK